MHIIVPLKKDTIHNCSVLFNDTIIISYETHTQKRVYKDLTKTFCKKVVVSWVRIITINTHGSHVHCSGLLFWEAIDQLAFNAQRHNTAMLGQFLSSQSCIWWTRSRMTGEIISLLSQGISRHDIVLVWMDHYVAHIGRVDTKGSGKCIKTLA